MPCVWWPWACQLLVVEASTTFVEFDVVSLEPRRVRGAIAAPTESSRSALAVIAGWAAIGAVVTLLAGEHRRSSFVCLSIGHRRVALTAVVSNLGVEAPIERPGSAAPLGEPQRVLATHLYST
jgi:hypothetical protein